MTTGPHIRHDDGTYWPRCCSTLASHPRFTDGSERRARQALAKHLASEHGMTVNSADIPTIEEDQ